jgi:hypothetical protein
MARGRARHLPPSDARGQHKVLIEVVNAEGNVFTGQTATFDAPGKEARP